VVLGILPDMDIYLNLSSVLQTNNNKDCMLGPMYDVIFVLQFILCTCLENLIDESCKTCKSRS
jgi:hypothetical protein